MIDGIDQNLAEIIKKATATDPSQRYQSVAEMHADLKKLTIGKKPARRAVATAAAFDAVKRNGSTIRAEKAEKTSPALKEKVTANTAAKISEAAVKPNDKAPEMGTAENDKGKNKKKLFVWILVLLLLIAAAAAVFIAKPWEKSNDDGNNVLPVDDLDKENNNSQGENQTDEGENKGAADVNGDENQPDNNENSDAPDDGKNNTPADDNNSETSNDSKDNQGSQNTDATDKDNSGTNNTPADNTGNNPVQTPKNNYYILPTDTTYISESDLEGMDRSESYMVINEIYARYGKIFKTKSIQDYFESQEWYSPVTTSSDAIDDMFNKYEKANIKVVTDYQVKMGYRASKSSVTDTETGEETGTETGGETDTGTGTETEMPETGEETEPVVPENDYYILPTDTQYITEADLEGMDSFESYMVINEIYARHGKIFKTESIQKYFESQKWYSPVTESSAEIEPLFTEIEKANLKVVVEYQKQQGYR